MIIAKVGLVISLVLGGCAGAGGNASPSRTGVREAITVIAFCGVDPADPFAWEKARTLAMKAGVDATMGPCLRPQLPGYTAAYPGQRYASRDTYAWLVDINASVGMKTYVYDPAVWTNPAEAIAFWSTNDRMRWIAGWDMGDEFQEEWSILKERWATVTNEVTPNTGITPFTNHFSWMAEQGLADFGQTSFDLYDVAGAIALAEHLAPMTDQLTCAFNALKHAGFDPTPASVKWTMQALRNAGCDRLLMFGGEMPINTDGFTAPSLVTWNGKATKLAAAVLAGAR